MGSISSTSPKLEKKALTPSGVKCSAAKGEAHSSTQHTGVGVERHPLRFLFALKPDAHSLLHDIRQSHGHLPRCMRA
jgi:hypothetical protein